MKKSKNNQGITLVALIVTIIILLILAGVTIALLSGENGILTKTEKAATTYKTESIKEVVNLKLANLNASKWIDEGRGAVLKDLNELDDENSSNFDAEITLKNQVGDSDTSAILVYDQHEIEVDSLLNITKIDGEKPEGTSGGNTNTGENGGNSSIIDSAEYAAMQEMIAQMQQEITNLKAQSATKTELGTLEENYATKSELDHAKNEIQSNREQIDRMLTTLDVNTRTTLFETEVAQGGPYTLMNGYSLNDFKYIIVYAGGLSSFASDGGLYDCSTAMINVQDVLAR